MADTPESNTAAPGGPEASQPPGEGRASANPRDLRSLSIQRAATDIARHAYIEAEHASQGDVAKIAQYLFEQSQVMAAASSLLVDAGCVCIAHRMKRRRAALP